MRNWILRKESIEESTGESIRLVRPDTLREWCPGKWSISEGDRVIVTSGKGLNLRFLAILHVQALEWEDSTAPQGSRRVGSQGQLLTLHAENYRLLPEDRVLRRLMYSLERVANLTRPYVSFRHHGLLSDDDVDVVEQGQIHLQRSVYFGLLRRLPPPWRAYFEARARARIALATPQDKRDLANEPPLNELWEDLVSSVIAPIGHAAQARQILDELGEATAGPIAESADGNVDRFNLDALLRTSLLLDSILQRGRTNIELVVRDSRQEAPGDRVWRPQRW